MICLHNQNSVKSCGVRSVQLFVYAISNDKNFILDAWQMKRMIFRNFKILFIQIETVYKNKLYWQNLNWGMTFIYGLLLKMKFLI